MFAVTGITGQVGGAVARTLLAKGCGVRAVVRDANKAGSWAKQGCEIAVADTCRPEWRVVSHSRGLTPTYRVRE